MTFSVSRPVRRLVVIAFVGGTLGGLLLRTFAPQLDVLATVLQVIGPVSGAFLFGWGWPQLDPSDLDERQQQVRYDVYLRSFLAISAVVVLLPLLMTIVFFVSEPLDREVIAALFASLQRPADFLWALVALEPAVACRRCRAPISRVACSAPSSRRRCSPGCSQNRCESGPEQGAG